ncbi:hypothetical protein GLYMA_16G157451v4 [Glycine max]|nr:hypothetical protein GLYMA_16G157451v4 [Glycine max]
MLLDARVCVLLMFWFRVWKKWGDNGLMGTESEWKTLTWPSLGG